MSNERSNEEWNQMWMKWMQNELFMGKFWAKIVVERWFYHWKTILVVRSKSGWNLIVGSWNNCWNIISTIGSNPDSIWGVGWTTTMTIGRGHDLGRQITLKRATVFPHERRLIDKIVNLSLWANISLIYWQYFPIFCLFDKSSWNIISKPSNTRYINDISSIHFDIFVNIYMYVCIQPY